METKAHEEKETLTVDVEISEHAQRTTTPLFRETRQKLLLGPPEGRCFICGKTEKELGAPLEAHHMGVERSFAENNVDWDKVKEDFPRFQWASFNGKVNPYRFVDDMTVQGMLLCKQHHTGKDTGIHTIPFPLWIMQRYLMDGTQWSPTIVIEHAEDDK